MKNLVYVILLISIFLNAQNTTDNFKAQYVDIKTPGITDFIKYGNMSSPSYTGNLNLDIPIISNPTAGGNPINISLRYDSSGFRPTKRPGLVGLNWSLNMGGAITRTVNGMPDDQKGNPSINNWNQYTNGFIVGVRNKTHNPLDVFNINFSDLYSSNYGEFYLFGNSSNNKDDINNYEGDPDIFSFNFNGISGEFFMGNDGLIKVVTNEPNNLKIDISMLQNQPQISQFSKPITSIIVITDSQGNKYHFGGNSTYLDYTANGNYPIITTWHMTKVEYYNGRVTNYIYRDNTFLSNNFDTNIQLNQHGDNVDKPYRDLLQLSEYFNQVMIPPGSAVDVTTTLQKIAILDKIEDDNFILDFTYSRQLHTFNTRNSSMDNAPSPQGYGLNLDIKLDKIKLYNKNGNTQGNLIKTIDFGYSYFGGPIHSRMFLTSLMETGKPPYQFQYNDASILPKPITFGIDHWGFWNGKSDNFNQLTPNQNYQLNGDFTDCTSSGDPTCSTRNSSFEFTSKGILNKIIYPTGGYTRFEFELNDYSKRLEGKSVNNYIPKLYDVVGVGGGLRIKKIVDCSDGVNEINIKNYEYKTDSGLSSGVLLSWPRYTLHYTIPAQGNLPDDQNFNFISPNPIGRHILEIPIVTYSQVSEITTGNGKIVTNFSDFVSNPDDFNSDFEDTRPGTIVTPLFLARSYYGLLLNDRSIERGKMVSRKIYDNLNVIKQVESFIYNQDSNKYNLFSAKLHLSGPSVQSNKIYYYNDYLTEKTTTLYTPSGNLVTTEKNTYITAPGYNNTTMSNQDILSETSTTSSVNNEIIKTEYKYPWQNYLSSNPLYINFATANIMYPIREIQYRNSVKLSEKFTLFAKDNSTNLLMLPKSIYSAKFPNAFANITDIGNLEKKFTYDFYDAKGNVTQYTQENGISVTIIWGYNKSQPIAKIENALLASISSSVVTNLQTLSDTGTEANLIVALNNLRSSLPNAMVTTYTHIPLIGVSTITDPKGDVSTYTYDTNNRLKNVKDKNGNILSEYQYHYKN